MTNDSIPELPLIRRYFPELTDDQHSQLGRMAEALREWNGHVNLISRKDIENLEERHILHSLAIAKAWQPAAGTAIADVGTGGGLPGLPLAIVFPECRFTLIDFVGKKANAVDDIVGQLGLKNVEVIAERAENIHAKFDAILGRAVAKLPQFLECAMPLLKKRSVDHSVFYFKGTHYREELADHPIQPVQIWELSQFFEEPFFVEKFLLRFA